MQGSTRSQSPQPIIISFDHKHSTGSKNPYAYEQFCNTNMQNITTHQGQNSNTLNNSFFARKQVSLFSAPDMLFSTKGMPSCAFLAMHCTHCVLLHIVHLLSALLGPKVQTYQKAPKGPNCLFLPFSFFFFPLNMKNMKADSEAGPC